MSAAPNPFDGPPPLRPMTMLILEGSHRPRVTGDTASARCALAGPAPMWLRELRRDTREQVL